jgi:nicotinamidase-related amidase
MDLNEIADPRHSALVLQEVQKGTLGPKSPLREMAEAAAEVDLVDHIAKLAAAARAAGVRVIHCTVERLPDGFGLNRNARLFVMAARTGIRPPPGSELAEPLDEVGLAADDILLPRYNALNPMSSSPLDSILRNSGITTMIVTGVSLNLAIPNLVFDAANCSYQVVVVTDAVAGSPVEYGHQVIEHSLSKIATLATTQQLVDCWATSV